VDKLSIQQLRGLFSGKITDWSMVGGAPGPVRIHARDEKSGTFDTFKTLVLNGDRILDTAKRYEDSQALSDAVAEEAGAIGFVGLPYIRKAKAIAVSADARSMAMRPKADGGNRGLSAAPPVPVCAGRR
jgi:phosphate transport system substrate-binding protein